MVTDFNKMAEAGLVQQGQLDQRPELAVGATGTSHKGRDGRWLGSRHRNLATHSLVVASSPELRGLPSSQLGTLGSPNRSVSLRRAVESNGSRPRSMQATAAIPSFLATGPGPPSREKGRLEGRTSVERGDCSGRDPPSLKSETSCGSGSADSGI